MDTVECWRWDPEGIPSPGAVLVKACRSCSRRRWCGCNFHSTDRSLGTSPCHERFRREAGKPLLRWFNGETWMKRWFQGGLGSSRCHWAGQRRSRGAQTEKLRLWRVVEGLDEEKRERPGGARSAWSTEELDLGLRARFVGKHERNIGAEVAGWWKA